jgi:hypothetical protein
MFRCQGKSNRKAQLIQKFSTSCVKCSNSINLLMLLNSGRNAADLSMNCIA